MSPHRSVAVPVAFTTLSSSASALQVHGEFPNFPFSLPFRRSKPEGMFKDVTPTAFPAEWNEWSHVGRERNYAGTPVFPDWNEDGILDFFYHNHFQNNPAKDWDFGVSYGHNLKVPEKPKLPWFRSEGQNHLICTEEEGSEYQSGEMDMHSTAILDIDRDGFKDMYISVGGGQGFDSGRSKNSVLLWGTPPNYTYDRIPIFTGGRDASEKAGAANENSRGRFTYFADLNRDGFLDMIFANDVRMDQQNRYGYVMYNNGDRTFKADHSFAEYTQTMALHDADGDGNAEEIVVQRRNCMPDADAIDDWEKEVHDIPEVTEERREFCKTRPEGSTVVYKYDANKGKMVQISEPETETNGEQPMAWSMQTGDFDQDLLADLVVLRDTTLSIFHSSDRGPGVLPTRIPSVVLQWETHDCLGRALRIADFDLDGESELLIMCSQPGKHRMYKRSPDHEWLLLEASLGDLASNTLPRVQTEHLEITCANHPKDALRTFVGNLCTRFWHSEPMPKTHTYGMAVVDWDNDGFADVALSHDFGAMMLLKNNFASDRANSKNRFIAFKLRGKESNFEGVGATVILQARNMGPGGDREIHQLREINTASHEMDWWGSKDDRIIFGLGATGIPTGITVRWPGGAGGPHKQEIFDEELLASKVNDMQNLMIIEEPRAS